MTLPLQPVLVAASPRVYNIYIFGFIFNPHRPRVLAAVSRL